MFAMVAAGWAGFCGAGALLPPPKNELMEAKNPFLAGAGAVGAAFAITGAGGTIAGFIVGTGSAAACVWGAVGVGRDMGAIAEAAGTVLGGAGALFTSAAMAGGGASCARDGNAGGTLFASCDSSMGFADAVLVLEGDAVWATCFFSLAFLCVCFSFGAALAVSSLLASVTLCAAGCLAGVAKATFLLSGALVSGRSGGGVKGCAAATCSCGPPLST
jgi:hypothetical protein